MCMQASLPHPLPFSSSEFIWFPSVCRLPQRTKMSYCQRNGLPPAQAAHIICISAQRKHRARHESHPPPLWPGDQFNQYWWTQAEKGLNLVRYNTSVSVSSTSHNTDVMRSVCLYIYRVPMRKHWPLLIIMRHFNHLSCKYVSTLINLQEQRPLSSHGDLSAASEDFSILVRAEIHG